MQPCLTTIGRRKEEKSDIFIPDDPFLTDFNKLLQSKALRRLAKKTQVLCLPDNPHIRTRRFHTDEVIAISTNIASQLGLNVHLCMAIAAGHDIGHTPYGHIGEEVLSELGGKEFKHPVFSVVLAQHIERRGRGANLTHETLEGMLRHSRGAGEFSVESGFPWEFAVAMFADKIAYMYSDINDAIRYGYLDKNRLPECALRIGKMQRERTNNTIAALVEESRAKGVVSFSEGAIADDFKALKGFMFEEVYNKVDASLQKEILHKVYRFFKDYLSDKPGYETISPVVAVALMTDSEANYFGQLMLKSRRPSPEDIRNFGVFEILPYLAGKDIDYTNPDLGWTGYKKEG